MEDAYIDSFCESHLNGGYGDIIDDRGDFCPHCSCRPCNCAAPAGTLGDDVSEFDGEADANDDAPELLPGEDMDGDHASALASAGFGTDEDYGGGTHDWESDPGGWED